MVFSSVPVYQLDPPQHKPGGVGDNHHLPPPMPPPPLPCRSIRPNSVSERARVTDFQKPERAQICPRCESTNTKFCYFNNYSLSQPRHFCKTCRRYWTRGGALRNVPVGGGCRRNKKTTKRSKLKSQITCSSTSGICSSSCAADIIGQVPVLPPLPQFPILPSIHHISDFGAGDVGLPFGEIQTPAAATAGGQWRPLQFPFLVGPEQPAGMPEFQSEGVEASSNCAEEVTGLSHIAAMQSEDQNEGVNLPDNFSGFQGNDYQYWSSGNAWTDLNGFSYPSTSHLL